MGAAGSRVANAGRMGVQEVYWRTARARNLGRHATHDARLRAYANRRVNNWRALHRQGLNTEAAARDAKRAAKAAAWAAWRESKLEHARAALNSTRKGAAAVAGAVAAGVNALGKGVGAAGSFLGSKARAAYNAAASKTRNAYNGLRALSLKRRTKNLFMGKVKLTNANRALAKVRGMNPNSTEFRKLLANRGEAGPLGNLDAQRAGPRAFVREGGLGRKVASLTRKAKEGLAAAAAVAAGVAAAAKNAVTKKASNWYAYGRNMVMHGRRRSDVERLVSARKRAWNAAGAAAMAIPAGQARNALEAQRAANAAAAKAQKELEAAARRAAAQLKKGGEQLKQAAAAASADKPGEAKQLAAAGAQNVASAVRTMQPAANNSGGFFGFLGRLVGVTRKAKNAVQSPKGGELTPSKLTAAARSATAAGQQLALMPGANPGRQLALAGSAASSVVNSSAHTAAAAGKPAAVAPAAAKPFFSFFSQPSSANTRKQMGNQLRGKLVQTLAPALAQNPGARMGAAFQRNRYAGFGSNTGVGSTPASSAATVRSLPLNPPLLKGSNGSASTRRSGSVRTASSRSRSGSARSGSARSGSAKSVLMLTNR